jgi:peptidoglycan/xylan/chitin deacetylase (PgdA/CDA1 family)
VSIDEVWNTPYWQSPDGSPTSIVPLYIVENPDVFMSSLTAVLYHGIADAETPFEQGLGVLTRPDVFESHVRYFAKNYDIVGIDDVMSGKLPRKALLITFDDCYRSSISYVKEILHPRQMRCLLLTNPSLLKNGGIALDNAIAYSISKAGIEAVSAVAEVPVTPGSTINTLIGGPLMLLSASERDRIRTKLLAMFPPTQTELDTRLAIASEDDLAECGQFGVDIGNHTAGHVACRSLRPDEFATEIDEARRTLQRITGQAVRAFSVPYGHEKDLTVPVLRALRESGHDAIFLVQARSNMFKLASDIWYRVSLHNEPVKDLPLRLNYLPFARGLRRKFLGR